MKKLFLTLMIFFFIGMTLAFSQDQTPSRVHEFGLTFSNLDNFGIRYKTGTQKTLLRLTLLAMNISASHHYGREQDSIDQKQTGMGAGLRAGFEKRILIVQNFQLLLGSDIGISYDFNKQDISDNTFTMTEWRISPGIGFVFGAGYQIGQHFILSAEVTPSLYYTFGKRKYSSSSSSGSEVTNNNFSFGLSNMGASITFAYRFLK